MSKMLQCSSKLTKTQHKKLYHMYLNFTTQETQIHNLSNIRKLPEFILFLLSFGLKFCLLQSFNYREISNSFDEILRKISWITFFKDINQANILSPIDKLFIRIKKHKKFEKTPCEFQNQIFPNDKITSKFISLISKKYTKENFIPPETLLQFRCFLCDNNLVVKNADKNAGICVMNKVDYEREILRQLEDDFVYIPSTETEYNLKMEDFIDKVKSMKIQFNDNKKTKLIDLINYNYQPANFYILPKMHKPFVNFPVGRPISSTCNTINKFVNELVDFILKPITTFIPNLIIDTNHLLLLLNQVTLNPNAKYIFVTYDILSMYTTLNLSKCKQFCTEAFKTYHDYLTLPFHCNDTQFNKLLNLCLDYNYVKFKNLHFTQIKGIQMGNSASVSVANITTFYELNDILKGKPEIEFNARFVDDGLLIINCSDIEDIDIWCNETFCHEYLEFTLETNYNSINFLDVKISFNDKNKITTSMYSKPMAKNVFLHYQSNHPKSLKESLPFCQFLRAKKICSNSNDAERQINIILDKFLKRGYPKNVLQNCKDKVLIMNRYDLLIPKTDLVMRHIKQNQPQILNTYKLNMSCNPMREDNVYIVMPFYSNMYGFKKFIIEYIREQAEKGTNISYRKIVNNMNLILSFKKVNSLEKYCLNHPTK